MSEPTNDPRPKLRLLSETSTRPFATNSVNDRWPVLSGEVRPAMVREIGAFLRSVAEAKTAETQERLRCEFYARHIKTWDAEGDDGGPLPITPITIACLPYPVWLQLEDIVLGYRGPGVVE